MSRSLLGCLAALILLPALATAGSADEYATQWPLELGDGDNAAYRVELTAEVYRQFQTRDLRDLAVLDADGAPLPAALVAPPPLPTEPMRVMAVPWFALPPAPSERSGATWQLVTEVDASGRLDRVEVQGNRDATAPPARTTLLVDLSGLKQPVESLELAWQPVAAFDAAYRVDASDDLEQWRPLQARGRLLDLRQNGHHLLQRRIELHEPTSARYLRLTPLDAAHTVSITAIRAVPASTTAAATPTPEWLTLAPTLATLPKSPGFVYALRGPFPIRQVDVSIEGNHAIEWRLESRNDPQADWRLRAGPWLVYQVGDAGSRPRVLGSLVRDRHWRLRASSGTTKTPPILKLGYRPEALVFLAQGTPPYRLVAGSTRARRADSPLPDLLANLRAQRGADWQPALARLGASSTLAGEAALQPVRDWKTWLLWGVLALGALLVAGFALSLLRTSGKPAD